VAATQCDSISAVSSTPNSSDSQLPRDIADAIPVNTVRAAAREADYAAASGTRLAEAVGQIRYYDELLTMPARLAAASGDKMEGLQSALMARRFRPGSVCVDRRQDTRLRAVHDEARAPPPHTSVHVPTDRVGSDRCPLEPRISGTTTPADAQWPRRVGLPAPGSVDAVDSTPRQRTPSRRPTHTALPLLRYRRCGEVLDQCGCQARVELGTGASAKFRHGLIEAECGAIGTV